MLYNSFISFNFLLSLHLCNLHLCYLVLFSTILLPSLRNSLSCFGFIIFLYFVWFYPTSSLFLSYPLGCLTNLIKFLKLSFCYFLLSLFPHHWSLLLPIPFNLTFIFPSYLQVPLLFFFLFHLHIIYDLIFLVFFSFSNSRPFCFLIHFPLAPLISSSFSLQYSRYRLCSYLEI